MSQGVQDLFANNAKSMCTMDRIGTAKPIVKRSRVDSMFPE